MTTNTLEMNPALRNRTFETREAFFAHIIRQANTFAFNPGHAARIYQLLEIKDTSLHSALVKTKKGELQQWAAFSLPRLQSYGLNESNFSQVIDIFIQEANQRLTELSMNQQDSTKTILIRTYKAISALVQANRRISLNDEVLETLETLEENIAKTIKIPKQKGRRLNIGQ